MTLAVPQHDCFVQGLGMYGAHHEGNPLQGGIGAEALFDEHIRFHFEREDDNPDLNLEPGAHFPIIIGKMRQRQTMRLQKPDDMEAKFIAIQGGCDVLFIALTEKESAGMYLVQLEVCVVREERPNEPIMMPPVTVHRYIKAT